MHDLWLRLKALVKRRQLERDMADELEFHLAMREQKLIEQGMVPREAHYAARRGFGNVTSLKETNREMWGFASLETLLQDVRYGLRMLRRSPGFAATAVLTLALGIGGTTAIFSVLYGAVLDPVPYADSHRLLVLRWGYAGRWAWFSAEEFLDFQEQNHVFDEVIGGAGQGSLLTGTDAPEDLDSARVTGNLFRVLGVAPLMGRPITPEDCKPGAPPVAVLSHKLWRGKFGGDPGILGRTLILDGRPTTVIGVMPPRFRWQNMDMWLPAAPSKSKATDQSLNFFLIGHLRQGVSLEQARADVAVLSKRLAAAYPKEHPKEVTFGLEPLSEAILGEVSTWYFLLGAVGLLLLIACVNVANLLLARATSREKEFAVRLALGATRGRLVRQLMVESLVLASGSAALGCLLGWAVLGGLLAMIPRGWLPAEAEIRVNGPVLAFTLGAALLSTLLFGLVPALCAIRKNLQDPLKASGMGGGDSLPHSTLRNLLVASEVALSLVLLTGAALLIRSFLARRHAELGYNPAHILLARVDLYRDRYKPAEQRNQFYMEFLRRVRALPGVVSASLGNPPPGYIGDTGIEVAGKPGAEDWRAQLRFSSDRYFETMDIRLVQGRAISEEDFLGARKVAVVNRTFVTRYFGDENPLGRRIKVAGSVTWPPVVQPPWFEVVGVIADIRDARYGPETPVQPELYLPYSVMAHGIDFAQLCARTAAEPTRLMNAVRGTVAAMDKELPLAETFTMQETLNDYWYTLPRFVLTVWAAFASLGLALVSIGVYGVMSYTVSKRTHEIGIRRALGAQATDVHRMVIKTGLRWLMVGIAVGVEASIALGIILQNRIWGIKTADPLTLGAVALLLTAVGLVACYLPARRATKVDPMVALKYE